MNMCRKPVWAVEQFNAVRYGLRSQSPTEKKKTEKNLSLTVAVQIH